CAADIVADLIELLFLHVVRVDHKQEIGAALQVEAEHEARLRPARPTLHGRFRKEIRYREETHHERRQDNAERLPPREIQHQMTRQTLEMRRARSAKTAISLQAYRPW